MGIVFRSGTKPDNLQENAWDVHDKTKNIKEEGIKEAKYAEATIPYNKNNVLALVDAHQNLAPILDKYKNEARDLDGQNRKRIVDRQIKNSEVRRRNIKTRLDTDLRNLQSLQNIVTATWGIAQDVDKINKINAEQERKDIALKLSRVPWASYEEIRDHIVGTTLLEDARIKEIREAAGLKDDGLDSLDIDKLLQPGRWYLRDAFATDLAYKTADTFPGWVASISEKTPQELFGKKGSLTTNSYAQAKANYAADASVANAAELEVWQSALENKFFEEYYKDTGIEGKFKLTTSNLFLDTRERVGTQGRASARKQLPKREAHQNQVVQNVRIRNYMNFGRKNPNWKEGDEPGTQFEKATDMVQALGWDFEKQTRNVNNGQPASANRVTWFKDIGRMGMNLQIPSTVIEEWLETKSDNGQTNRERWAAEIEESGLLEQIPIISGKEAEQGKDANKDLETRFEAEEGAIKEIFQNDKLSIAEKRKLAFKLVNPNNPKSIQTYQKFATHGYNIPGTLFNREIQQRINQGTFTVQWLKREGLYNQDIVDYYGHKLLDIQKVMPVHDESQPLWNSYYSSSADIVNQPPKQIAALGNAAFNLDGKPPDNVLHPTYSNFILEANGDMQMYYQEAMLTGIAVKSGDKSRQLTGPELEAAAMRWAYAKLSEAVEDGKNGKGKYRLCSMKETGYGKVSMCDLSASKRSEGLQEGLRAKLKAMRETDNGMKKWAGTTGDGSGFLKNEVLSDYFFTPRDFFTKLEAYNKDPENNEMPTLPDAYYALQQTFGFDPLQTLLWQAEAYNKYQVKEGGDLIEFNPSMLPDNIVQAFRAYGNIPRQFLDPKSPAAMAIGKVLWESQFTNPSGQPTLYGIVGTDEEGNFDYELNPNYFSPVAMKAFYANDQRLLRKAIEDMKKGKGKFPVKPEVFAYGQDYRGISKEYYND